MVRSGAIKAGEPLNFVVPTGNFGNILAAFYAKQMGLPVGRLICASNENRVLFDFFKTGCYDKNREFILTSSPSMDILISSNLERLIYRICGNDSEKTAEFMKELSSEGKYDITDEMKAQLDDFYGGFATEEENFAGIKDLYEKAGYVIDTHTGIANAVYRAYADKTKDSTPTVIASTASPFKFAVSVIGAIAPDKLSGRTDFELIDILSELSATPEPYAITDIRTAPVRHKTVVDVCDMAAEVKKILGV
jgi:threonine synthase